MLRIFTAPYARVLLLHLPYTTMMVMTGVQSTLFIEA